MYHKFFIHSSVNGHLGYLHSLAIVNSAAMNIEVHESFQLWFPSSGITGSYDGFIHRFFFKDCPYCPL